MRDLLWPPAAVQPRPTGAEHKRYVRSYLIMRVSVGFLGLAVPLVLVLGDRWMFDAQPSPRSSISSYYYSGMRDFFVGALCAIGIFLITYKVAERSRENRLSTYAGLAAVVVALFPTGGPRVARLTPLQDKLGETTVEWIHFGAATAFIVALGVISYYFARPGPQTGKRPPSFWRKYHLACAVIIAGALVLAAVEGFTGWPDKGLLFAEWIAVWAFGASWFMKGFEIRRLFAEAKEPAPQAPAPSAAP